MSNKPFDFGVDLDRDSDPVFLAEFLPLRNGANLKKCVISGLGGGLAPRSYQRSNAVGLRNNRRNVKQEQSVSRALDPVIDKDAMPPCTDVKC